jgi:glucose-1-phosphate cytidylyltransferase
MKVLILAGGYGTRISEETGIRPKPMVEIGYMPILWHIMKNYSTHGFNEFIILCGYKGNHIKNFFANYFLNSSSMTFDLKNNSMEVVSSEVEPWKVTCLDTGAGTMTGGRIKRAEELIGGEPFLLTYGDGVSDIDISASVDSHKKSGRLCTMSAVQPGGRFGVLEFNEETDELVNFIEKPKGEAGWINGGFFVCQPEVLKYLDEGDSTIFERKPLETLARENNVNCYKHRGYWQCMDTLADKKRLVELWNSGEAKWKTW